jgi:hypothetical protein
VASGWRSVAVSATERSPGARRNRISSASLSAPLVLLGDVSAKLVALRAERGELFGQDARSLLGAVRAFAQRGGDETLDESGGDACRRDGREARGEEPAASGSRASSGDLATSSTDARLRSRRRWSIARERASIVR